MPEEIRVKIIEVLWKVELNRASMTLLYYASLEHIQTQASK